jgi:hypothetical protein
VASADPAAPVVPPSAAIPARGLETEEEEGQDAVTPPREVFADITRKTIEDHDEWDSPHCFMTLHWDGERLTTGTYACIIPGIDPGDYPALMRKAAADRQQEHPDDPACAYLLQIEAFGVIYPGPDAGETEREQFDRDRIARTFHKRPDAIESAIAWCADIHGRTWTAAQRRSEPGVIHEHFYAPGRSPGGWMLRGLLAVAYATGVTAYGLPGPQGPMN